MPAFIRSIADRLLRPRYVKLIVHVDVLRDMGGEWAQMAAAADAHRSVFLPKFVVKKLPERFDPIANMQRKLEAGEHISLLDPNGWLATTPLSSGQSAQPSPSEGGHLLQTPSRCEGAK